MNRGIYPILSGALAQERRLQVISNNLANSNTTAYKRDEALFQSFMAASGAVPPAAGVMNASQSWSPGQTAATRVFVSPRGVTTGLQPGRLHATRNPLDLAIQGPGFFEIRTPAGIRYTRNGTFHLTSKHQLVTEQGYPVMGKNGPVKLSGSNAQISPGGTVHENGQEVARIKVVEFPPARPPQKAGDGLFIGEGARPVKEPTLVTGHLEESDVNAIGEMIQLIEVMRVYESAQRMVQTFDHMSEMTIQEVGRVV